MRSEAGLRQPVLGTLKQHRVEDENRALNVTPLRGLLFSLTSGASEGLAVHCLADASDDDVPLSITRANRLYSAVLGCML